MLWRKGEPNPARVAVVASSLFLAGAEKQTTYMARALFEAGLDTRFFYLGRGGYYEPVLRRTGMPFRQICRPERPLWMLARLVAAFGRFRPHVVLVPQFGDLLFGALAGRCWTALVLGGLRSDGLYELTTYGARSPWMLRLAHSLIANSHCARQNLAARGVNPERIEILPNVLDLKEFDTCSRSPLATPLPADRVFAVAVGRLVASKRFDRFLDALALARRKAPALCGMIAGAEGGAGAAWRHRAQQLGLLPEHVLFLGECAQVPALLRQAAFLVLCSEYEGFPNVILEAMAARRAVITTPAGDAALIVEHGRSGFVVADDDITAMADSMVRLAQSAALCSQYGEAGRKLVEEKYSYHRLAESLTSLFRLFASRLRKPVAVQIVGRSVPERRECPKVTEFRSIALPDGGPGRSALPE